MEVTSKRDERRILSGIFPQRSEWKGLSFDMCASHEESAYRLEATHQGDSIRRVRNAPESR